MQYFSSSSELAASTERCLPPINDFPIGEVAGDGDLLYEKKRKEMYPIP